MRLIIQHDLSAELNALCLRIDDRTARLGKHACWHMDPCDDAGAGIWMLDPLSGALTAILRCLLASLHVHDL